MSGGAGDQGEGVRPLLWIFSLHGAFGGSRTVLDHLLGTLLERGWRLALLCVGPVPPDLPDQVLVLELREGWGDRIPRVQFHVRQERQKRAFRRLLERTGPPAALLASLGEWRYLGLCEQPWPLLLLPHVVPLARGFRPRERRWLLAPSSKPRILRMPPKAALQDLLQTLGLAQTPQGWSHLYPSLAPTPQTSPVPDDPPLILTLGHLAWTKDPGTWLEVAARVQDQVGGDGCRWVWLGAPFPGTESLEDWRERARALGLEGRVFPGFCSRPDEWFARASLYLQPSRMESFGIAVSTAMAWGLPVVASRLGGLVEQVEEGRTGFLVEPGDVPALVIRVLGLLRQPEKARAMGQAGRERQQALFSGESWRAGLDEALKEMNLAHPL